MRAYLLAVALGAGTAASAAEPGLKAFAAGKPVMPSPLSRLKAGMSEQQILSTLGTTADRECFTLGLRSGELCVVPFWLSERRHAVLFNSLRETRSQLEKKWGPPIVFGDHCYWVNPGAKPPLRARLRSTDSPAQLDLEEYLPMRVLLGDGPGLGFETQPIIGSTAEALKAAYGASCEGDSCSIVLPPSEVGSEQVVLIDLAGGKATSFSVDVPLARDEARTGEAFKMLEKKWGARKLTEGEKADFTFERRDDVRAYVLGGDLTVRVGRR